MIYLDHRQGFFGREDVLELFKKRILGLKEGFRQNIALLGHQYVGKTSVLQRFTFNLDEKDVIVIHLDLENKDLNYFFTKFVGSLLYNYSKNQQLPLHDDINILLETTKSKIPHTVQVIQKIKSDFIKGKTQDCYLGLFTLPEVFTNETGHFCLLILDEFQNLEELFGDTVFQNLGKKIMTQKRCLYIVTSSHAAEAKTILSEKLSLLFGNFETVDLGPLKYESSQKLIQHNLANIKIGVHLSNFLTDFTAGHPLYMNLICHELHNLCAIHNQSEVYLPLLAQSVENTIFNRWGVISRHFEIISKDLCRGKSDFYFCPILMSLANGNNKVEDLMAETGSNKYSLIQKLNRLIEQGVVIKNNNFYYVRDKLFRFWVKYVFQKRLKQVELQPDKLKREFKEEFQKCVDEFNSQVRQDVSTRISDLLHCFDNEALSLNGRQYKLPVFDKLESKRIRHENGTFIEVIEAASKEDMWFVIIKQDNLQESDINSIVLETKRMEKKPKRCLVISLTDVEENAKLRALQERFWIWNDKELNTLLMLFNKPFIIR